MSSRDSRKRKKRIEVYFSDEEFQTLEKKMEETSYDNREEFIRNLITSTTLHVIDISPINKIRYLVSTISNNINQIAKKCNETDSVYATDLMALNYEHQQLRTQLEKMNDALQETFTVKYRGIFNE